MKFLNGDVFEQFYMNMEQISGKNISTKQV